MKFLTTIFLFLSLSAFAIEFKIENVCEEGFYLDSDVSVFLPATVADITHYTLNIFKIPYVGDSNSISSMLNTPTGNELVEFISNDHYFVYGWCYEVDGVQPDVLMSQYSIDPYQNREIRWLFGYAEFRDGGWASYCTPLNTAPRDFICRKF